MRTEVSRALRHLRRALELLPTGDERRPAALARLGRALLATSDYPEAAAAFEAAVEILRARGEDLAAAELGAPLAIAVVHTGRSERGEAVLAASRAELEHNPGPGLVSVLAEQAVLRLIGEHPDAAGFAEEAIALATSLGLPPPYRALMVRGSDRPPADREAAEGDYRAAIDGAVAAGDLRAASVAIYNRAAMSVDRDGPRALTTFDQAIDVSATFGLPTEFMRSGRVEVLLLAGKWDDLLQEAQEVRAWALTHGDAWSALYVDLGAAQVRLERGDMVGPRDDLASTARDVDAVPTEAVEASSPGEVISVVRYVRACLRAGAPELARRALAVAAPRTAAAERSAAEAMIAEAEGDVTAARAGYARAAGSFEERGDVYELAYALAGLGRCLVALGETEKGITRLRESREIWVRLRATPRIAEIDAIVETAGAA